MEIVDVKTVDSELIELRKLVEELKIVIAESRDSIKEIEQKIDAQVG